MPSSSTTTTQPPTNEYSILSTYLLNPSTLPQITSFTDFVKTCVPSQYREHPHIKRLYRDLQFQRNIDVDAVRENIERECLKSGILKGRLAARIANETGNGVGARVNNSKSNKRKRSGSTASNQAQNNTTSKVTVATTRATEDDDSSDEDGQEGSNNETRSHDRKVSRALHESTVHPAESLLPTKTSFTTSSSSSTYHNTSTLLDALESSVASAQQERDELEMQTQKLLTDMQETVSQLSDLRYGRFARVVGEETTGGNDGDGGRDNGDPFTLETSIIDALHQLEVAAKRVLPTGMGG